MLGCALNRKRDVDEIHEFIERKVPQGNRKRPAADAADISRAVCDVRCRFHRPARYLRCYAGAETNWDWARRRHQPVTMGDRRLQSLLCELSVDGGSPRRPSGSPCYLQCWNGPVRFGFADLRI